MLARDDADDDTSAADAHEALQRSDRVRRAGGEIARNAIRVHLLRQGVYAALLVVSIGAIYAWLRETWPAAVATGVAVGVLSYLTERAERAAPVRAVPGRGWSALVTGVSAVAAYLVGSAVAGPAPLAVAVAAATVAAFAIWAVWAAVGGRVAQ